jgi:putative oxidoreductase
MADARYAPYGVFLLRVALGGMWIAHALLKWFVFTIPGFASWLETQGLPGIFAWPVFLSEIIGGTAILIGFYARHVALALIPILVVALSTHVPNGWVFTNQNGGWEYPAYLIVASFAQWLVGDGAFSLRSRPLLFIGRVEARAA